MGFLSNSNNINIVRYTKLSTKVKDKVGSNRLTPLEDYYTRLHSYNMGIRLH